MTFADIVKRLRETRGMSQREVAAAGGNRISAVAICRIERGDRPNQTIGTVQALAEGLGFELRIGPRGIFLEWPIETENGDAPVRLTMIAPLETPAVRAKRGGHRCESPAT